MVNTFARRMTELRRKRGITQKQASISLGISQALLSHYEKGVRECGLDFLLKAAAFYEVSTDYLLGREKKEPKILTPAQTTSQRFRAADRVLFDMIDKTGDPRLLEESARFLSLAYYRLYRRIYFGGHAKEGTFPISEYTYRGYSDASMQIAEVRLGAMLDGHDPGAKELDLTPLQLDKTALSQTYGKDYILLSELLQTAEQQLEDK